MAREVVCPHCGLRLPIEPLDEPLPALDAARTIETIIPRTVSTEDTQPSVAMPGGSGPPPAASSGPNGRPPAAGPIAPHRRDGGGLGFAPLGSPDPDELPETLPEPFPRIELASQAAPGAAPPDEAVDEGEPRTPWPMVLLASYASAMTLACLWLWSGRRAEPAPSETIPADSRPELPSSLPASPVPPVALAVDRVTSVGQPLRVGWVEIMPLDVRVGQVELEHRGTEGEHEWRDGGPGALFLRLRLTNTSTDQTFAPLEPAYVREPDRGRPESFLESPSGERIDTFPLPQASEWAIVGQGFRELKPGESFETVLVSKEESAARFAPEMVWRVRLRTGQGPTEFIGVRIRQNEVK